MEKSLTLAFFFLHLWGRPLFAAEKSFHFVLADIEPYIIHQKNEIAPIQGLEVEILNLLAEKIQRPIIVTAMPTRRYVTGTIPGRFDGSIYSDYLYERLPNIKAQYEVVGKVFKSSMLFLRKYDPAQLRKPPEFLTGVMGEVSNSCDPFLLPQMSMLQKFDVKDPDQGVLMLYKDRLDFLCMSDTVVYRLMRKQNIGDSKFEILWNLGGFSANLVLNRDLPAADRGLFRNALNELWKKDALQPVFLKYNLPAQVRED